MMKKTALIALAAVGIIAWSVALRAEFNAEAGTDCYNCYEQQKGRDFAFSAFRK